MPFRQDPGPPRRPADPPIETRPARHREPPRREPIRQPDQRPLVVASADDLPSVFLRTPTAHPYLFRKRIARFDSAARPGDLVVVRLDRKTIFGYGLFNPRSEILVRMVRFGGSPPDDAFWNHQLTGAIALRREVLGIERFTDSYRLIHSEGDGLSGIVVDKFGDVLSGEAFGLGMYQRGRDLLTRLATLCGARSWILRAGPATATQEGFEAEPIQSAEAPNTVTIQEFGTRFRVRFAGGHKTGFFCDQRENRRLLASYCEGKSVLDLCCYTGGFAVQAKKLGNASEVTGIELDSEPLQLARENANLNQVRVNFVQSDVFAYLRDMLRQERKYDVVVLDPPKLIRTRAEFEEGRRKHFDLNRLAMQLVRPGGLFLSCTCSGLLDAVEFQKLLYSASRQSGAVTEHSPEGKPRHAARTLQFLERTGAAPDHPVAGNCPEGEYLQAAWMRLG